MYDYKNLLAYQPIITTNVISIVEALQDKSLTKEMFHNRKAYAKKVGNVVLVLEYTTAYELVKLLKEEK